MPAVNVVRTRARSSILISIRPPPSSTYHSSSTTGPPAWPGRPPIEGWRLLRRRRQLRWRRRRRAVRNRVRPAITQRLHDVDVVPAERRRRLRQALELVVRNPILVRQAAGRHVNQERQRNQSHRPLAEARGPAPRRSTPPARTRDHTRPGSESHDPETLHVRCQPVCAVTPAPSRPKRGDAAVCGWGATPAATPAGHRPPHPDPLLHADMEEARNTLSVPRGSSRLDGEPRRDVEVQARMCAAQRFLDGGR